MAEVALRPVDDSDLDALFEQMRDPESVRMAAFTAENPDDRSAFDVHMTKVRTSAEATTRAVTVDGRLVGSIASFVVDGDTEVTYWIDRSFWGQGIAGRALALLLESVRVRPLFARAASDNVRSLKVLQSAGFAIIGTEISFANGRNKEIEETILRLDDTRDRLSGQAAGKGGTVSNNKAGTKTDSPAVALAIAHLEAWTNRDFDTVRANLAKDVQFYSPAANLVGIDEYMDAPRGLTQFARQVVPGSLRVVAAMGDQRNALIMYEVSTEGGPIGSKVFPSAQTWLLDDDGKIKVERIVSYMAPR